MYARSDASRGSFSGLSSFAGYATEVREEPSSVVHSRQRFRRVPKTSREGQQQYVAQQAQRLEVDGGAAQSEVGSGIVSVELVVNVKHGVGLTCATRDGKVVVKSVEPGTPAHTAGLRPGWQIFSVNNCVPHSIRDVAETLKAFRVKAGFDVEQVLPMQVVAPLPVEAGPLVQAERDCILAQYEALHKINESRRHLEQRRSMHDLVERERGHTMQRMM
eukprot:TRINITY_DN32465_c0_g1_i1.p2 TRINITY_DN32465_c0_g1~~TRINITY_DN32465_c0_g1_i1.p2  ORF type:complete len:218 (+),score=50.70 TRINITY_DN32465_c0_g1_i1:63-716(+)